MENIICLDQNYSTTRLLIQEKPKIINNSEDEFESVLFLSETKERKGEGGLRTKGYFKKSYEEKPLISIITVVFNGEKYLEETIQSVINQTYNNIEYIIIDGGSTDGTLDIIKKYENQIDYWVSEKDAGIYDAMNKGLKLSSGEYISFLNADDWYLEDAIKSSVEALTKSRLDYSISSVKRIPSNIISKPKYPLNAEMYQGMMYPHIGALIKREVYDSVGLFNTKYKLSADFDLALRIHIKGFKCVYVDTITGIIREGGVSATEHAKFENMLIAISHGRNKLYAIVLYLLYVGKSKISSIFKRQTNV